MRENTKIYWISTGLFCLIMTAGGAANLVRAAPQIEVMETLGYPAYLMTILGVAKLLGVVALLAPGRPILKEWAYAGFTIDMLGAAASHAFVGDPILATVTPLAVLGLAAGSYFSRPAERRPDRSLRT
ncbi:MAG: DoxX family protein [Longimicrobiales bacterium]